MNFKSILALTFTLLSLSQGAQAKQLYSILGEETFAYYGKSGVVTASAPGFKLDALPNVTSEKAQEMYKLGKSIFQKTQKELGASAGCTSIFMSYTDREDTYKKYKEGLMIQIRQQCPNQNLKKLDIIYGVFETEKDQCTVTRRMNQIKTDVVGVCDLHDYLSDANISTSLESTINTALGITKP
jgi:hypothetical protein